MYLSLWLADYSDLMSDMDALQSNNYQNHGRYNSADYDRYVKAAKSKSAEQTDRYWENMRNAQNQLTKRKNSEVQLRILEFFYYA